MHLFHFYKKKLKTSFLNEILPFSNISPPFVSKFWRGSTKKCIKVYRLSILAVVNVQYLSTIAIHSSSYSLLASLKSEHIVKLCIFIFFKWKFMKFS